MIGYQNYARVDCLILVWKHFKTIQMIEIDYVQLSRRHSLLLAASDYFFFHFLGGAFPIVDLPSRNHLQL